MIQGLRPPRWLACAVLAAAALAPVAPAFAAPLAPAPGAAARATPDPLARGPLPAVAGGVPQEDYEERAGSAAGVGRERPGRPVSEPANPEAMVASRPRPPALRPHLLQPAAPTPTAPPPHRAVTAFGTEPNERAADLAAHILPLGTGFALMGLGLGYLGMRLRRGL